EKTLDSAHEQYDSEERAHRTAWSAVKHVAEKKGDHWELKDEPGPSDPQSKQSGRQARDRPKATYGGVNVEGNTKDELYERAKKLDIEGRSNMTQEELAAAIGKRQCPRGGDDRGARAARPYGPQVSPAGVTISS